jgi:hypothetical protein
LLKDSNLESRFADLTQNYLKFTGLSKAGPILFRQVTEERKKEGRKRRKERAERVVSVVHLIASPYFSKNK